MSAESTFPIDALPRALSDLSTAAADASAIPAEFVAVPGLSVLAAATAGSAKLELSPVFQAEPILWGGVSSPPGSAKTQGGRQATRPLERLEEAWSRDYSAKLDLYLQENAGNKQAPPPPARRRILVQNSTIEALPAILLANPGAGLLWEHSELASIVGGLDQYHGGGRSQSAGRADFISLWDGRQLSNDRVGAGHVFVPHPLVSVTGALVSERMRQVLGTNDGLSSRFLIAHRPDAGLSIPNLQRLASWDSVKDWEELVHQLVGRVGSSDPVSRDPLSVHLNAKARGVFHRAGQSLQGQWQDAGSYQQEVIAKATMQMARLSLILHLANSPGDIGREVDAETVDRAVTIIEYFVLSALAQGMVEDSLGADNYTQRLDSGVSRLVGWLQRRPTQTARRREAQWAKVAGCRTAAELDALIKRYAATYEDSPWVVLSEGSTTLAAPGIWPRHPVDSEAVA